MSRTINTLNLYDSTGGERYTFGVSNLAADRTVTLPLLGASDEFTFNAHTQTLTNKTLTTPVIASISNSGTITIPTGTDTLIGRATTDTLTNKTLTSPVWTTPQLNDTSLDHQYIFAASELTADRTVTMPLLTGNDEFVFQDHTQTLTNKTLDNAIFTGTTTFEGDEANFSADYLFLNHDSISTTGVSGGIVMNYDAVALGSDVDVLGFASATTVDVVDGTQFAAEDIILVTDANTPANDGYYQILSKATNILTIRTAGQEDFVKTAFVTDVSATGTVTRVNVSVMRANATTGAWETEVGATGTALAASLDTVALLAATQTFTNKTLTTPVIASISNSGTITVPTGTDTLVGRATTDTLTNKTLTSPVWTTPQLNDTSLDHQYIFAASELIADRTVTMPLLTGNDTFVFESHTQTLTNKTLTSPVWTTPQLNDTSADHQYVFAVSELAADRTVTMPLLTGGDTFVFESHTQTLTNKTLTGATLTSPVLTTPEINDTSSDHQYVFAVNELAADRTVTLPLLLAGDEFTFNAHTQTLTNKTLTTPVIASISNSGTITIPTGTDTLVGRATTDTLTNKTLTSPVLTTPQINDTSLDHQYVFAPSELAADRTVTLPLLTGGDTFVFEAHAQTLTNKTLTAPVVDEVNDVNGNEVVIFSPTVSAVNEMTSTNAATGNSPLLSATGDDTDIDLSLQGKGTGNVRIVGDAVITGDFTVQGTTHTIETDTLNVGDNNIFLQAQYTTVAASEGGITVNYLPTATTDTVNGAFVAGVAAVSNPTVVTTGASTFSDGDVIVITDANTAANNGLFEVLSQAANLMTIRGIGTSGNTFNFFQNQFTADAVVAGTITQINVSVIHAATDGDWEVWKGLTTVGASFTPLGTDLQSVYTNSANPEIGLSASVGGVTIRDNGTPLGAGVSLFEVQNDAGTTNYFKVDAEGTELTGTLTFDQTNDLIVQAITQTTGAGTAQIPDLASTTDQFVMEDVTQTLTNKTLTGATLTSPILTTPQINDTSSDHQYVFAVNELAADRTVTLPLLLAGDEFTFNAHTQTLTNKTLTTPVIASISNSGTITIPTGTDTLVGRATTDTLTNKTLTSPVWTTPQLNDTSLDHQYIFSPSELAADRTVTMPLLTGNDTFVFEAHTQTLTNKTLDASSNTVRASSLATSGSPVVIVAAAPPTTGQILKATSATVATWQTDTGSVSSASVSTTDATVTQIATIATTTDRGYILDIKCVGRNTTTSADVISVSIKAGYYNDGGTLLQMQDDDKLDFTAGSPTGWRVDTAVDTTSIDINVTGAAATNIDWQVEYSFVTV